MTRARAPTSNVAFCGAIVGMMLLGFAATLIIVTPQSVVTELEQQKTIALSSVRRLATFSLGGTGSTSNSGQSVSDGTASTAATFRYGYGGVVTTTPSSSSGSSSAGSDDSASSMPNSLQTQNSGIGAAGNAGASNFAWNVILGFINVLFAFIYYKKAVAPILLTGPMLQLYGYGYQNHVDDDFAVGICECFSDPWVCLHGLCCPFVRMGHTNSVSGVLGYWPTILTYFACSVLGCGVGQCFLMVYWRKKLKNIMGIDDHVLNDMLVTCCCPSLSICQQASAVDMAMGYEVVSCCELEFTGDM